MKNTLIYILIFVLSTGVVYSEDEFAEAKKIADAKIPCAKLTENQLEAIGDYIMEQMRPGKAHELMDEMMGGEGSESLRQAHIAMAKRIYCNDTSGTANYGMMWGMMSGFGSGINYGGMMSMMGSNWGYGMMGNYGYGLGYWNFLNFLSLMLVVGLVVLVYLWIIKLWKDVFKKESKVKK